MNRGISFTAAIGIFIALAGITSPLAAEVVFVEWTGAGGTNLYGNAANWSPQVVPTNVGETQYDVLIDVAPGFEVVLDINPSVNKLVSNAVLRVNSHTLTVIDAEGDEIDGCFKNEGTVLNTAFIGTLIIDGINTGEILCTGGTLRIQASNIDNTSGEIRALGGTIELRSDTVIDGGVIETTNPDQIIVSSSGEAFAKPVAGTLVDQLDTLNGGPPEFDGTWLPVLRHADFHSNASFVCDCSGVSPEFDCPNDLPPGSPADEPYVAPNSFIDGADEVTLDNCSSAFYRFTFNLDDAYFQPSLSGTVNVDDQAVVFLNAHQISGTMSVPACEPNPAFGPLDPCYSQQDVGSDPIDFEFGPVMTWPTLDSFGTDDESFFVVGENELVFAVAGDASYYEPTGVEFTASVSDAPGEILVPDQHNATIKNATIAGKMRKQQFSGCCGTTLTLEDVATTDTTNVQIDCDGGAATLRVVGDATFMGAGRIEFVGSDPDNLLSIDADSVLTIGPAFSIVAAVAQEQGTIAGASPAISTLVNMGTLQTAAGEAVLNISNVHVVNDASGMLLVDGTNARIDLESNAIVEGGTLVTNGGELLVPSDHNATLSSIVIDGTVRKTQANGCCSSTLFLDDITTLDSTVIALDCVSGAAYVRPVSDQVFEGAGRIEFIGTDPDNILQLEADRIITIGPEFTVVTAAAQGTGRILGVSPDGSHVINQGTIDALASESSLIIDNVTVTNAGDGQLVVDGGTRVQLLNNAIVEGGTLVTNGGELLVPSDHNATLSSIVVDGTVRKTQANGCCSSTDRSL